MVRKLWETWKRIGQQVGNFVARVVLTLFYFTLFMPFGVGVQLWSDPLRLKGSHEMSFWVGREPGEPSLDDARRGF